MEMTATDGASGNKGHSSQGTSDNGLNPHVPIESRRSPQREKQAGTHTTTIKRDMGEGDKLSLIHI